VLGIQYVSARRVCRPEVQHAEDILPPGIWQTQELRVAAEALCAGAHPGGRCTTTAKAPCPPSIGAMGTVSTHRVNEPHKCTCTQRARAGDLLLLRGEMLKTGAERRCRRQAAAVRARLEDCLGGRVDRKGLHWKGVRGALI
jgi:hypothetical protein